MNQRERNHRKREQGAALLLTLLMLSLLVVLVGQFSYTVVLDRKVALNYISDAQVSLDILAGVEAAAGQIAQANHQPGQETPSAQTELQLGSDDSRILVSIEEEDAKFNVNILLEPPDGVSPDDAQAALERLLKSVDEPEGTLPAGLGDSIAQYLLDKGSPALTLRELTAIEGVTDELLYGGPETAEPGLDDGFEGLSKYLTVWSDGLIDYNSADEKVLLSLVEGLNEQMLQMVLQVIGNPSGKLPPNIQGIVNRMAGFVKPDGSTFSAVVQSQSGNYAKRCMAVLRRGEGGVSLLLWDELEP